MNELLSTVWTALAATSLLEWSAVTMTAVCIFLAGRNNVHTWWTGLVATALYAVLFFDARLYADVTLQGFFMASGVVGWWTWVKHGANQQAAPITRAPTTALMIMIVIAVVTAVAYGTMLGSFTDAFRPNIDSLVLTFSVVGQLLLVRRNIETWPVWILVNTLSVPLYFSRELWLTAIMYSVFWVNAVVSWYHWHQLAKAQNEKV